MGLALVVHGGAGTIAQDRYDVAREGCRLAAVAGWDVLRRGGSALDAVQAAITTLEDHPGFNAGTGGVLNKDGRAQLDAGIMDGASLDAGAVAAVERIKNPIALARAVLASSHVLLMGAGAEQFATEAGIALCDPSELVTTAQYARWQHGYHDGDDAFLSASTSTSDTPVHADGHKHGTVGAVALDARGDIAAGASTGGMAAKYPGRIGDTPLVGCGYIAENGLGGVASTGHGEHFIRLLLARRVLDGIAAGRTAQEAAAQAIVLLGERLGGTGGLVVLDAAGRVGIARNTQSMAHAYITEGMPEPISGI